MENSILNQKLFKMAYTDTVTDLGNETYFKENGSIYLLNTKKNKYILTLDIFRFKALNNIYGFEFCNKILKLLAIKIKTILPEDNIMCRISNDIFATVFSYDYDIRILLDKLIKEASKLNIENKDISINLSIGAYKIKEKDRDINNVLSKAYMWLMYSARLKYKSDEELENLKVNKENLLSTSEEAIFVTDLSSDLNTAKSSGKAETSEIAAILTKNVDKNSEQSEENKAEDNSKLESKLVIVATGNFITDYTSPLSESYPLSAIGSNKDFVINAMAYLGDKGNTLTIRKDMASSTYQPTNTQNIIVTAIVFAVPVVIIIIGIVVWSLRKRRK